jgi:hypothetical protein
MISMAKRKAKGKGYDSQFSVTAANLAKKGKTNKKLKRNPMASKYETAANKEITAKAAEYVKMHPPGSGRRAKKVAFSS